MNDANKITRQTLHTIYDKHRKKYWGKIKVISKRMVKKQQIRWTRRGAHLLLQVRIKTLNHELRQFFCQWYPKGEADNEKIVQLAA